MLYSKTLVFTALTSVFIFSSSHIAAQYRDIEAVVISLDDLLEPPLPFSSPMDSSSISTASPTIIFNHELAAATLPNVIKAIDCYSICGSKYCCVAVDVIASQRMEQNALDPLVKVFTANQILLNSDSATWRYIFLETNLGHLFDEQEGIFNFGGTPPKCRSCTVPCANDPDMDCSSTCYTYGTSP